MTTLQKNIKERWNYPWKTNTLLQLTGSIIAKNEPKNSNVKTSKNLKILKKLNIQRLEIIETK